MTVLYHGLSPRDAVLWLAVRHGATIAEGTIRAWVSQGKIQRTPDGQIDPFILDDWWIYQNGRVQERGGDGRYGHCA